MTNFSNPVVQQNSEEYQEIALTTWLPQILQNNDPNSTEATQKLASLLHEQHSDPWLRDFLSTTRPNDTGGIQALASAITANQKGLYNQALRESSAALKKFEQNRNAAGEARARFEEVYALRSLLRGADCLRRITALEKGLPRSGYQWLQTQTSLERAQCENKVGNRKESDQSLQLSLVRAKGAKFRVLELRVEGISAGLKQQQTKYEECWKNGIEGFRAYWNGTFPYVRLSQFYEVLWQSALNSGYPYTAEVLLRQDLEIRKSPYLEKNEIREGLSHLYLDEILRARNEIIGADAEKAAGIAMLSNISEEYSKTYRVATNIEPAERQLQQENAELALKTLKPLEGMLKATQDNFFSLRFYRLLGNIYLRLNKLEEASGAYESAIHMAEISLASLKNDKDRLEWLRATGESYRGLVRVLLEQKKSNEALARWEWYKSRSAQNESFLSDSGIPARSQEEQVSRSAFKPALPHSIETRLIYASFEDGLQIWLYRNGHVESKWVHIQRSDLEQKAQEFTKLCSNSDSSLNVLQNKGAELYSLLLQPIAPNLPEKSALIAEPDSVIYTLPLGALRSPSGRYVEEKYSIVYSPGIWIEQELRRPTQIEMQQPLLLVDASRSADTGGLPGVGTEIKAVSDLFSRATVVNSEGTDWTALRPKVAESEILVFIGHGRREGNSTALVLNSKESLGSKDFSRELLTHMQLAVLSACSTGTSDADGLLDTDNLVHSFLAAGVPRVIASRWNVESRTTAKIMTGFYTHLRKHESVAQAMTNARREMLREMPHPYYWAAFSVSGRVS